jgi:ATP-dependent DNA helicase DinG
MNYFVIDVETTGLSCELNQVLTIGALVVCMHENAVEIIDSIHLKVKHERYNVSGIALKINKINLEQHHNEAIPALEACNILNEFFAKHNFSKCFLLGHNIFFDIRFLQKMFQKNGHEFKIYSNPLDTLIIWKNLRDKGLVPLHLKAKLKDIANYFGIDIAGSHNALIDCHITANVYYNLREFMKLNHLYIL